MDQARKLIESKYKFEWFLGIWTWIIWIIYSSGTWAIATDDCACSKRFLVGPLDPEPKVPLLKPRLKHFFLFLSLIPKQCAYCHVQQMALLGFSYHLMPQLGFEPLSVELHHDPGPFEGPFTNWATSPQPLLQHVFRACSSRKIVMAPVFFLTSAHLPLACKYFFVVRFHGHRNFNSF